MNYTISCRIKGAFGLIEECFNELQHGQESALLGWGDSIRDTIDEVIRTYKSCVEQMDEKISKLLHGDTATCKKTANLIDATLKPCNTNECAIRARSLATKTTGEENEEI